MVFVPPQIVEMCRYITSITSITAYYQLVIANLLNVTKQKYLNKFICPLKPDFVERKGR